MSTRIARLWQPGNPQRRIFLPDFWVAVMEPPTVGRYKIPKNCVKFQVDPRMSRHDVREYLTKIYNLPVRDVRIQNQMGDIEWAASRNRDYRKAMWKDEDKKFAFVFMSKGFEFEYPNIFYNDEERDEIIKFKENQEQLKTQTGKSEDKGKVGQLLAL